MPSYNFEFNLIKNKSKTANPNIFNPYLIFRHGTSYRPTYAVPPYYLDEIPTKYHKVKCTCCHCNITLEWSRATGGICGVCKILNRSIT